MSKTSTTYNKRFVHKRKDFKGGKGIAANFAKGFDTPKKWYEELAPDPKDFLKVSETKLIELKDEAKKCHDAEIASYNIKNSKTNSDYQWMKTVMSKGTVSDKVAAYTVLIQDDPVCNLPLIQNLINMVKVGKNKECLIVMDNFTELLITDLLIPDSKLKLFHERSLSKLDEISSGNAGTRRKYLSLWYFEDQLKESYTQYVLALNKAAHDSVDANKEKAISAMYRLLSGNPEQEKNLLSNIVNKLGDPSQKVACKTIYCLGQLQNDHPAMKQIVLNEIEKLLFRPNVSTKAQYYGICFLTQFYLSHEDFDVAKNLINVYFSFFKACVKKGDVDSRMMSALLMGVNRAYPYAKTEIPKISEHIDTMYKVVHVANFNVSLHTLNLLYQVSDANNAINDRFYSALYKKLLDPNIGNTTHKALLLNLIFRALKKDTDASRIRAFIKRLLQVASYSQPAMACGILFLIFHVMYKTTNLLATKIKEDMLAIDDEIEHFSDVKPENDDITALEVKVEDESDKTLKERVRLKNQTDNIEDKKELVDLTISETNKEGTETKHEANENKRNSSWVHADIAIKSEYNQKPITSYNPIHRNPKYAGGEFCVYTELLNLQNHFHPTVALFASKILNEDKILYSGDPLKDFTLVKFLERFSFKNPKKIEDLQKPGINPVFGKRKLYATTGIKSYSVMSQNFLTTNVDRIPVEEMFLYKYLQKKHENRPIKSKDLDEDEFSDAGSVDDDEFEEMLDQMAGKKKKVDHDDDLDFMNDIGNSLKQSKDQNNDSEETMSEDEESETDLDQEDLDGEEKDSYTNEKEYEDEQIEGRNTEAGDMENEDLLTNDLDGYDGSDFEFLDSDDESSTGKAKPKWQKKGKKDDIQSLFASADEFASILDEEADFMAGTSHAVANRDQAHKKQLVWEQNRHHWLQGKNKGKKNDKYNKKRKNPQIKSGNKNKKQKR